MDPIFLTDEGIQRTYQVLSPAIPQLARRLGSSRHHGAGRGHHR